jgi:formate C-acetyltransferase
MGAGTGAILSAQEQAIVDGKKVLHGTATDRVLRILDTVRSSGPPRVALERAVYFTESFKTTEGQPLVWRWAKALEHIAKNISVAIFDDELIVGRASTWFGRYSLVYPELDGTIIQAGAEAFIAAKGAPDAVTVTEEDKKIIDGTTCGVAANPAQMVFASKLTASDRTDVVYAMTFPTGTIMKIMLLQVMLAVMGQP